MQLYLKISTANLRLAYLILTHHCVLAVHYDLLPAACPKQKLAQTFLIYGYTKSSTTLIFPLDHLGALYKLPVQEVVTKS